MIHQNIKRRRLPEDYISNTAKIINPRQYRCPKCGAFMEYITAKEIFGETARNRDKHYLICRKDDIYCKTKRSNSGNVYLESTPADKETRLLRSEVHYYLGQLYENGILPGKDSAYFWLTHELGFVALGKSTYKHVGEMDAFMCKRAISLCINKLIDNIDRLENKHMNIYMRPGSYTMTSPEIIARLEANTGWRAKYTPCKKIA